YGAFGRRETDIALLDARAGTPPTAGELLRRHSYPTGHEALRGLLKDWEHWCAELLESHLSYPVLAYFRSQHDNQSWVGSLTAILDVCALAIVGVERIPAWQARLTFAMARHAMVDISQVFGQKPKKGTPDRLPPEKLQLLRDMLAAEGVTVCNSPSLEKRLTE